MLFKGKYSILTLKFPKLQYDQILKIIKKNNFDLADFYLVKRKGWIRIEHSFSGQYFTYFKKKETRIDPVSKEWENSLFFKIKTQEIAEIIEPTFDSMLSIFDLWLKKLNQDI